MDRVFGGGGSVDCGVSQAAPVSSVSLLDGKGAFKQTFSTGYCLPWQPARLNLLKISAVTCLSLEHR